MNQQTGARRHPRRSELVKERAEQHPPGQRVRAVWFDTSNSSVDDNKTVPPGTEGIVRFIDDGGTCFTDWANGAVIGFTVHDRVEVIE